ncbi:AAA family ATPase [Tunturiibacter gelidiferens]|uniref:AAA family ATPase n=1 Tax=Tunturiibacter gelidiferens TaxID=3069689 RepID=UPI003D9B613F
MGMQLKSFRVKNFRSVDDSGVIETDGVTALIGINESGKSNLLLPLWKLNPAKDGEIKPTADYPRKSYNDFRGMEPKPIFIEAIFTSDKDLAQRLATLCQSDPADFEEIHIQKSFSNKTYVSFPKAPTYRTVRRERLVAVLSAAATEINAITPMKVEEEVAARIKATVTKASSGLSPKENVAMDDLANLIALLPTIEGTAKTSSIAPRYAQLQAEIEAFRIELSAPLPNDVQEARNLAYAEMPSFVYYTNYGNLDSEIYLPHVIENMKRAELGAKEQAKVRTLKVLFEFVGLKPEEILELGLDFQAPAGKDREPTEQEIAEIAEKKKERSILLQSASTKLTQEFRSWWKQGEYRFRFEADGDHFRIWVSDDKRPEEVELEGRSTGLQWFLSFYLVFLVESRDTHAGAILLLDEPGTSLHPLAQKDLSAFFDGLSESNQLVYTTHSPFLIDSDRLDRARKVYVAADGTTKATPDLRESEGDDKAQRASGYAVYAALGLTVAESLLLGCTVVIVEGTSDQMYLSAIKNILIGQGKITPHKEVVFPPAGGAKGVKVVASILSSRDEALPVALFDSDATGKVTAQQLMSSLYVDAKDRVFEVATFTGLDGSEIEDLIPGEVLAQVIDRWQRGPEVGFADSYKAGTPIVPQIEAWAKANKIELNAPGWKVEVAKRTKQALLGKNAKPIATEYMKNWEALFATLLK